MRTPYGWVGMKLREPSSPQIALKLFAARATNVSSIVELTGELESRRYIEIVGQMYDEVGKNRENLTTTLRNAR